MLRIINYGNTKPKNYIASSNLMCKPGMIGQLVVSGSNTVTLSDGIIPLGIIDDIRDGIDDSISNTGLVTIYDSPITAETDQYEAGFAYLPGRNLYVSDGNYADKGILTPRLLPNRVRVGVVISPPSGWQSMANSICFKWVLTSLISPIKGFTKPIQQLKSNTINNSPFSIGSICTKCNFYNNYIDVDDYICYKCKSGF